MFLFRPTGQIRYCLGIAIGPFFLFYKIPTDIFLPAQSSPKRMTLAPKWTWRSRCFFAVSFVFWLLFTLATIFLATAVANHISKNINKDSIMALVVITAMGVGSFVWALGFARLRGVNYHAHSDGSFFIWREQRSGKLRERKIDLTSIESFWSIGSPSTGYSLEIITKAKTHRLGLLLSKNDIYQLLKLIEHSKAEQANAGNQRSAVADPIPAETSDENA